MKDEKRKSLKKTPLSILSPEVLDRDPCLLRNRRPCPDCRFCQGCSQDRCRLCRSGRKTAPKKLSIADQIALYERINKKGGPRKK